MFGFTIGKTRDPDIGRNLHGVGAHHGATIVQRRMLGARLIGWTNGRLMPVPATWSRDGGPIRWCPRCDGLDRCERHRTAYL